MDKLTTGPTSLRHITVVSRTCLPLGHSSDIPVRWLPHSPVHLAPTATPVGHTTVSSSSTPTASCTSYGPVPGTAMALGNMTATDTSFLLCCGEGTGHHGSVNNMVTSPGLTIGSPTYISPLHEMTPVRLSSLRSSGPTTVHPAKILWK